MADELDAELLALAGDASDEEPAPPRKEKASSPASSNSSHSHPQHTTSSTMSRRGTTKAVKRNRQSRKADAEDGELSSAESHQSLQSASMSESESDSDATPPAADDDGPIFPYEKLYHSAKDKQEIMALPEIQREQILSERAQEVDRHNQDLALRRLLASREREEARRAKKNKRKVSAAGLEDGQRKSSRQKTTLGGRKVGEASGAIEAYKRQREQKSKRDEFRRRDPNSRDQRARLSDGEVSDDADGESEVERDDRGRFSPSPPKDDPPADFRDVQRARVGRSNFAQVCFYPGFDDAISGCFARVNVGPNRETGQNEYRLCLIKKFVEGRPYGMEGPNDRPFITNQYALLAQGKAEREFPFIACSDSPFTEAEFNRYRQTMAVEDFKMPTKSMVAAKLADINRLLNHQFTNEELNEKLRKQGSFDNKTKTFKRIETEKALSVAKVAGDYAEVEKLEVALSELTMPKLAFGASLFKPRQEKQSEQERLAEINLRNQKLNYENVRRAQLEEKKASRKAAAAVARGEVTADPFMRTRAREKIQHDTNGMFNDPKSVDTTGSSDLSQNGTPIATDNSDKASTPRRSATPSSAPKRQSKGVAAIIRHRNMDDENIANLELDIDVDI